MSYQLTSDVPSTPFYYYDMALLGRTLAAALSAAQEHGYALHYALKANVEPSILQTINAAGFGADCVSGWEVQSAIEAGFSAANIVFAGVGKSDAEILLALENDIFSFNCESLQELEVINELAKKLGKVARVALRINPDVEPQTHKYISTGQKTSKFGIAYLEFEQFMDKFQNLKNIDVIGLHFHIGSQIMKLEFFEDLAVKAAKICQWFESRGLNIRHLNMGGGLGIDYYDGQQIVDFEAYFACFAKHLPSDKKVHFELGRSIVAQCGELISRVLFTKQTASGEKFIILDAGMTELIRPALYAAHHNIENLSAAGQNRPLEHYYIGGPICESSDIFAHDIEFVRTIRGDVVSIKSAGAYGSVMSSRYNCRPLAKAFFGK